MKLKAFSDYVVQSRLAWATGATVSKRNKTKILYDFKDSCPFWGPAQLKTWG